MDEAEEKERLMELNILIDQLVLCDMPNLPIQLNRNTVQSWVELHAEEQIEHLETCLKAITSQEDHKERDRKRDLFVNPQTRGQWLDLHFKTSPPTMPPYAIDSTGIIHREPDDVKNVYLTEGTLFLRKKLEAPGPEVKQEKKYPEPPDLKLRKEHDETKEERAKLENSSPKWWNLMYNRKSRNISDNTWANLMKEPSTSEILETIKKIPNDKAAGYDGVEINLIKLLVAKKKTAP
jgi:hypothetical protein